MLFNNLISNIRELNKTVAVICIDPTSPFSGGAILGDRIRMNSAHSPRVYMRSMATRRSNLSLSKSISDTFDFDI